MTDAPDTPGTLTAAMLKQVFETDALIARHINDRERFPQLISAGVAAFVAAEALVFLTALDPEAAARFAAQVAERLDDGDLTNWAWCHAVDAGWDPQLWAEAPR
ncbi:hypothetical protein [Embleya sp. NPDC005971]|uniref:hypothetical protein n=1 Tax=Embleya sp. NPDC005971 TaxID=3156724 RepID=UPI0033C6246B